MSEKTLKFGDIVVNKKEFQEEFHTSKQAIDLNSVKTGKILVSYKLMMVLNILLAIYIMGM